MIAALEPCFTGNLVWYGERMALAGEREPSVAGTQLLEPCAARQVIGAFAAAYPGCDGRAVVSLWTQWYFAALVIPSVAAAVRLGRVLPVGIGEIGIVLGEEGQPDAIVIEHDGTVPPLGAAELFEKLISENMEPLVAALCRAFAVSPRLMWSNAATVLEWALSQSEAGIVGDAAALAEGRRLLHGRMTARGLANPLHEPVRYVTEQGTRVRRRRVCCLRYLLNGEEHCGSLCPLPSIRRSAS